MNKFRPSTLLPLLTLLLCVLGSLDLHATHLVGGSLNYEYLGENPDGTYRYRIYSVTFTDCGPSSNFPDPEAEIPVAIYENDLDNPLADKVIVTQFDMPRVSFEEVVLAGIPDGCDVGSNICVEQGNYEFFVNLPLNFDGYWIYYDRCCRNDAVVNLSPLQGVGMSTYIPSPLIVNSSPFFNAPPTPFLCAGDTTAFLNTAIDPDGDLMVFSFINPFRGYGSSQDPNPGAGPGGYQDLMPWEVPTATYNPGYGVNQPFGANGYAFINGATGLTTYMVPSAGQYAVAIEIKEYRNGVLIGITRRDLQLTVINCPPNPAPDLSDESQGNTGYTSWEMDEGATLCFPIIFTDENGDSLFLSSFGEVFDEQFVLPSATINTPQEGLGSVQADFCWVTDCTQGQSVPYFFGVTSSDNGCPPKSASEVYIIQVVPFTGATLMDGEESVCENSTETYSTDDFADAEYVWTVSGGAISAGQGSSEIDVDWGSAGSGTISVTITNFRGCVGDPFDLDVTISPLPVIDAGADISICAGDTVAIGGSPTGPGGSFFIWGPNSDISSTSAGNPEVFPLTSTSYEVQVISSNSCSARDTIDIIVNQAQLQVSDDEEICSGTSAQLTASGAVSYVWTPAISLDDGSIPDPTASPNTTTTYTVTSIDANTCTTEAEVTVTVFDQPVANAGTDMTLCGLGTALAATPSTGEGAWTASPGASVAGNDPDAEAFALGEGLFEFTWTETTGDGLCISEDIVEITFVEMPTADPGIDDAACGLEYTLGATPTAGNGAWTLPAGLVIAPDNTDPGADIVADAYGSYTLTWTETNQLCQDAADVTIEFIEVPTANAGLDDSVCGDSYSLDPTPSLGEGMWSGPANLQFADPTAPNSAVTSTSFGPQVITWTEDNGGGCTDAESVTITFNEIPSTDAGEDQEICGLQIQGAAIPSVGTGTWTAPSGITVNSLNDAQSQIEADAYGSYDLTWSEDNAGCTDVATVTYTFIESPQANAGLDDDICGNEYTMGALPSLGNGTWTGSGNVDIQDPSDPNSIINVVTYGTEILTWIEDNDGCTNGSSVSVTFFEIPQADAGVDFSICGLETELDGTSSIGNGIWTAPAGISINELDNEDSPVTSGAYGTYTMTWTEDSNGCVDSDEVAVTFDEVPVADAGADEDLCIESSLPLSASGGDSYGWSPSTGLDDPTSASPTASPTETTTYIVVVSLANGCDASDTMTVNVNPLPVMDAGEDISYLCYGDSAQLNGTPGFTGYEWFPGTNLSNAAIANPYVGPLPQNSAVVTYELTVTDDNGCQRSATVDVSINPDVPTDAGPDTLICQGEPVVLGAYPVSPDGTTYMWSPNTAIDDVTAEHPTVTPLTTTTYTVVTDNSICSGFDLVTVIVEETPVMNFLITASPSCTGLEIQFDNVGEDDLGYTWDFGDGSTSTDPSPFHEYAFNAQYTVVLEGISDIGCVYEISELIDATDFASYFDLVTPNVLTPNGDGVNDELDINVIGQIEECLQMQVFNRWGQLLFEASGNNTRWDGRTTSGELVQPGVYFYFVEFNGTSHKGSVQVLY